jgi:peptidoglycan/xylan/chitin deacetylase (PgdA/CDA1 family)
MVDPRLSWGMTRVTPRQFDRQITLLVEKEFDFLTITDYLHETTKEAGRIAITFDDGYESVFLHAWPILQRYNIPATVFVNPEFIGQFNGWDVNIAGQRFRHMDWQQIDALHKNGWEIGSHGMRHRDLTRLSDDKLERELTRAAQLIKRRIGVCSSVLSYPFGNTNARVERCANKLGFDFGLSMGMQQKEVSLQYAVQRRGVYFFDSLFSFRLKVYNQYQFYFSFVQRVLDKCSDCTVMIKQNKWQID